MRTDRLKEFTPTQKQVAQVITAIALAGLFDPWRSNSYMLTNLLRLATFVVFLILANNAVTAAPSSVVPASLRDRFTRANQDFATKSNVTPPTQMNPT
ncbi:MAG: hypothetical protein ACD_42C00600G0002, partial [uncultured bacterium]